MTSANPVGLRGIDFVEFTSSDSGWIHTLLQEFGFSKVAKRRGREIYLYSQGSIRFLLNAEPNSFASGFATEHGPCVPAMAWKVENAVMAYETAIARGAEAATHQDHYLADNTKVPAIKGIGGSLIYFVEESQIASGLAGLGFEPLAEPEMVPSLGFTFIDHLTNNVEKGTMEEWSNFYKNIFGFTEVRYFDIRGAKTGLLSYALRSPDGSFCIPINEGTEKESQINEYLREYKGAGVQHIAFATNDILTSLDGLSGGPIETLDIDDEYYQEVFERVPGVTEDKGRIQNHQVLVDGDESGYLLQIFTKNVVGPIFIEIIQRKNHLGFGEGNFGALFRAIERDQERRGVI